MGKCHPERSQGLKLELIRHSARTTSHFQKVVTNKSETGVST